MVYDEISSNDGLQKLINNLLPRIYWKIISQLEKTKKKKIPIFIRF